MDGILFHIFSTVKRFIVYNQLCVSSYTSDYTTGDINAPRHYLFENKEYVKIKTVSNCKSLARRKSEFARISSTLFIRLSSNTWMKWIYTLAPGITIEFEDHIQCFRMQRARLYTPRKLMLIWERYIQHYICIFFLVMDTVKITIENYIWDKCGSNKKRGSK